ncbi:probable phosphoglycerate mutase [Nocardioides scoriae]|uniref:Probable phosphoglycerate mutase n=1 Tax=Nocardioides scoriae TaxID=642780 RepID=A0A1H1LVP1_9ACTN|nr:histidine phosphatase family protein [Nocardioides scoriae]SDR78694.1 probable phosphoglycerate mutase [Nocardioides scoriae]
MAADRRLVLVRHGRTAWNAEGRAQGHTDIGLDHLGRAQAEQMAPVVAALDPVLLVTSDLARARQTAARLEQATGLVAEADPRLREYDTGARTGLTFAEYAARVGADAARSLDVHAHVDAAGAETVEQVGERIVPALREVLERVAPGQTAVAVLHGAALRVGVAGLLGWPLGAADGLEAMRNCGWAVLRERAGGRLRLAAYNQTAGQIPEV